MSREKEVKFPRLGVKHPPDSIVNNVLCEVEVKPDAPLSLEVNHPPESVHSLLCKVEGKTGKPPRYTSKFLEQIRREKQQNKAPNKTMGVAKPSTEKNLQKHSTEPKLPEKKPFSYQGTWPRKPQEPAKIQQPSSGVPTKKNFRRDNAMKNIMVVPRQQPAYVHTTRGDKVVLENSGLIPKYTKKKDFGQTPEYLKRRREKERRDKEEYDQYVKKMEEGARVIERHRQEILQDFGQTPEYPGIDRDDKRVQEEYDQHMKKMEEEGAMMQLSEGQRENILKTLEYPAVDGDGRRSTQEEYDQYMKKMEVLALDTPETRR